MQESASRRFRVVLLKYARFSNPFLFRSDGMIVNRKIIMMTVVMMVMVDRRDSWGLSYWTSHSNNFNFIRLEWSRSWAKDVLHATETLAPRLPNPTKNVWCTTLHIRWCTGFSANLVIVTRNGSMSLADLPKRNIDLSIKMPCQEFSNYVTDMCLCWSFSVFIVIALWCVCTLVSRRSRTYNKITASVGSYRSHKSISELHVISLCKPSIYSKTQALSMQERVFCFVFISI